MINRNLIIGVFFLVVLGMAAVPALAGSTQTYLGNTVKLSGYCYSSPTVYLFLTGPNLPSNGVALDNVNRRADQGGFTEVSVDSDNRWEYDWYTGGLGLDAGAYTVWAVNSPTTRANLGEAEYTTISVSLGLPSISVTTPVIPGSFDLRSTPDNASVVINGVYKGHTPLTIADLEPGTYQLTFSRFDYDAFSTPATIEPGSVTEVTATLVQKTGALSINTTPPGAAISIDGTAVGTTPFTITGLSAGNHTVNATLDGYLPSENTLRVIANQTVTRVIELQTPASPAIPGMSVPLPVPVTIGACCLAVLIVYFVRDGRRP